MIVGWATGAVGGGKERRYVRDDGHQRAGQRALTWGSHGDDDVILIPHVEGVWVGVAEGRWQKQRVDSFHLTVFSHFLIDWAQQTVCRRIKEEG